MRSFLVLIAILLPLGANAGVGGGGVGPRPMNFTRVDFVRTLSSNNEEVTFLYKAFDQEHLSTETVSVRDISSTFLTALSKSQSSKSWAPVNIED